MRMLTLLGLIFCAFLCSCGGSAAAGSGSTSSSSSGSSSSPDAALLGETFYLTIDDSSYTLADYGKYKMKFSNGTYQAPGEGSISNSSGTFTANIVGGNIIIKANDNNIGIATWTFTFDGGGNEGTFKLETINYGDQYGVFSKNTYLPAPIHAFN